MRQDIQLKVNVYIKIYKIPGHDVKYEAPNTAMWCPKALDTILRNGCMSDYDCLENARGECDKNPACYGVSWYQNDNDQPLKLCLSGDLEPKDDGWRTMMKLGNYKSFSFDYNTFK